MPRMLLMGLVSFYDAFLSKLVRLLFITKPDMLSSSERNISFRDLAALGNVEAAKEMVIEKEVETVIRKSHHEQISWLETKLGITLTKDLEIWPGFIELCERRNLFTHTDGKVSDQYLTICREYGADTENTKAGDRLSVDVEYLQRSTSIISELSLKLVQVVWRKMQPEMIGEAAVSLSRVGYDLISQDRYQLASKMLKFGLVTMKKQGSDLTRKMMVVNHANAEKLAGHKEKADEILRTEDWSAASAKFRICVAAVQDDVQTVLKLLEHVWHTKEVTPNDFRTWPVFRSIRENADFVEQFEKLVGEPLFLNKESVVRESKAETDGAATSVKPNGPSGNSSLH